MSPKVAAIQSGLKAVKYQFARRLAAPPDPQPNFAAGKDANAIVVFESGQPAGQPRSKVLLMRESQDPYAAARAVVAGKPAPSMPAKVLKQLLERIEHARYALLVVPVMQRMPALLGDQFMPGQVKARVHLWDLDTGKRLAGFEVSATNSPKVNAATNAEMDRLNNDLSYQFGEAIRRGITENLPGATPPDSFGFNAW